MFKILSFADCSRAGSFYSVTNQLRGRRSVRSTTEEFSFENERPNKESVTKRRKRDVRGRDWSRTEKNNQYYTNPELAAVAEISRTGNVTSHHVQHHKTVNKPNVSSLSIGSP